MQSTQTATRATAAVSLSTSTTFYPATRSGDLGQVESVTFEPTMPSKDTPSLMRLTSPQGDTEIPIEYDASGVCWSGDGSVPGQEGDFHFLVYNCLQNIWLVTAFQGVEVISGDDAAAEAEMAGTWGSENGGGPVEGEEMERGDDRSRRPA
jgi:hypothetical protein